MSKFAKDVERTTQALLKAVEREVADAVGSNRHRLAKGKHLSELEHLGARIKAAGEDLGDASPLQFARAIVENAMFDRGMADTRLDDAEVSITRKAYRAVEPEGGLDAEFEDVYAIHPATGHPLVNDAGLPLRRKAAEVPVNKIYYVSDYLDYDFSAGMSFANRSSEKRLRTFNRLAKKRTKSQVFTDIKKVVAMDDKDLNSYVAKGLGLPDPAEQPQFKNITVPAEVYDEMWRPLREMASLIVGFHGLQEMLDEDGRVQPGMLLRDLISVVDPRQHGPWPMLQVLVEAQVLTTEQAAQFKVSWEEDGLADRWAAYMDEGADVPFEDTGGDLADEVLAEVEKTPF